jgi:hypothetical protein
MKNLPPPPYDDIQAIDALSKNKRIKNGKLIRDAKKSLIENYRQYIRAEGNAFLISPVKLNSDLNERLEKLYSSPNIDVSFIDSMRSASSYKGCPMCGSLAAGTLDHFFSQDTYPEFIIFSKNLVPACKCNSARQEKLKGKCRQRILHPYFDRCLSERLLSCSFNQHGIAPSVNVKLAIDNSHAYITEIKFHFETIVANTEIEDYLHSRWTKMITKPELVIRSLENTPTSLPDLIKNLEKELGLLDDYHESKNNWESIFVSGLLEAQTSAWLYGRLTRVGRQPGAPLA